MARRRGANDAGGVIAIILLVYAAVASFLVGIFNNTVDFVTENKVKIMDIIVAVIIVGVTYFVIQSVIRK